MSDVQEIVSSEINETTLTEEMKKSIDDLIVQFAKAEAIKVEIDEATTALAAKLGVKKAVLKKRVAMIRKEKGSGGEVKSQNQDILFVEKYFLMDDPKKVQPKQ